MKTASQYKKVKWYPTHPKSGSVSMQRYWAELQAAADRAGIDLNCPFKFSGIIHKKVSRLNRAFALYIQYPLIALFDRSEIIHMLDHGAANVFPFIGKRTKLIVTVHDLVPLIDYSELTAAQHKRACRRYQQMIKRADVIVSISEATKQDLVKMLGVSPDKVRVIYNGFSPLGERAESEEDKKAVYDPEKRIIRILSVGSCQARKNLTSFPAVFTGVVKQGWTVHLFRVGPQLPCALKKKIIDVIGEDNLHEFGRVPDSELFQLYHSSHVLFFPSKLEGFGLPLLEAMGNGCPVVSSNATSLPEVGGDAVLYFDPDNFEEAACQLIAVMDPNRRARLVDRGYEQVKKFSWDTCFSEYCAIYTE